MRADRAAAGLSGAAILVVIALAPGGVGAIEPVLLVAAGLVVLATFAPALPVLHRLSVVGAPRVSCVLTFEPAALTIDALRGLGRSTVLRVGFVNDGPHRVEGTLVNVLVNAAVEIEASDHRGDPQARGSSMPATVVDGRPMNFWAEKDGTLPVGSTLLHYRLQFPVLGDLGEFVTVRVSYNSDDL